MSRHPKSIIRTFRPSAAIPLPLVGIALLLLAARAHSIAAAPQASGAARSRLPRPLLAVTGTSLSYYVAKPREIEPAIADLAPYFDIVWVVIPTWAKDILHNEKELQRARQVIDTAHRHGLAAALKFSWARLLPTEAAGGGKSWFGYTLDIHTGKPVPAATWDFGSVAALAEFRRRCARLFALLDRRVEMLVVDEEVMAKPGRDFWFRPISTFWTSPTYSEASLSSFKRFLARRPGAGALAARFPVTTAAVKPGPQANEGLPAVPLGEHNRALLVADNAWPDSPLWKAWYDWRCELYASWLGAACAEAYARWGRDKRWLGCCYVMPDHWAKKALGQDLSAIAAQPHVDYVCAGYMSGTHFDWFAYAASLYRKKWGALVQLCTYGKRQGTQPEVIKKTFKAAVDAGADIIHVYAGANFRTDRREPKDTGLYYMPEQVKAWEECLRSIGRFPTRRMQQ